MTTKGNVKGLDELGQEVLWSSQGQQVMMQWEKQYMELCVDALAIQPTDRVLEIGFGLAYSASHIQTFRPKSHTIIECDQEVLQRARQFAVSHNGVEIVSGTWQQQLPTLDQFDCVFFDDYPLPELETGGGEGVNCWQRSRWHDFLDVVLKHCATGARITGYLARELNLQRPGCKVTASRVQVNVPQHCDYFPHKTALVPVITVLDPAATGVGSEAMESLFPLPLSSKKFQRAFENAFNSVQIQNASFSREQGKIVEIHEFLLAHEMDALSYERSDESNSCGVEDTSMDDEEEFIKMTPQCGYEGEKVRSIHYRDEESRREYLRTLRNKVAASKQAVG